MKRKTTEQFIIDAIAVHGDSYDYTNSEYIRAGSPITIICPEHGEFTQRASNHTRGVGCPKCGDARTSRARSYDLDKFMLIAQSVHGQYDYTHSVYRDSVTPIDIVCTTHGVFSQRPDDHLSGKGCLRCGIQKSADSKRHTCENFVNRAIRCHNGQYDYSLVDYINARSAVKIICPTHGEFKQTPGKHLGGAGCPKCGNRISKISNTWLDSLGIPDDQDHREVDNLIPNRKYTVDGYDPATKTVYEFHGDYWHGNPKIYESSNINPSVGKTYGQLYQNTLNKKAAYVSAGFEYVEMWESDWKNNLATAIDDQTIVAT